MTDRELLEMAAKAAGEKVPPRFYPDGSSVFLSGQRWNPLTDDGDALRLAVKLGLDIHFEFNGPTLGEIVEVFYLHDEANGSCMCEMQQCEDDPYAATRRAIVRAAAEIARAAADGDASHG